MRVQRGCAAAIRGLDHVISERFVIGMDETFEQLDEVLLTLGAKAAAS